MQYNKLLDQAHALALKAKPWILQHEGKTYTAVYSMSQSVYEVFEDGIFFMNINMKSPAKAKQFLKQWLTN
jgi:hypothetical protein